MPASQHGQVAHRHDPPYEAFGIQRDNKLIFVTTQFGEWLESWDIEKGKATDFPRIRVRKSLDWNEFSLAGASSPDGSLFALQIDKQLIVCDMKAGKTLRTSSSTANCLTFSPDGKRLATCDGPVRVWDVATGNSKRPTMGRG